MIKQRTFSNSSAIFGLFLVLNIIFASLSANSVPKA